MKKICKRLLSVLFVSLLISCNKDDETNQSQIQFTENGLQVGVSPIVNDTIMSNSNMSIELVNTTIDNVEISNIYELELQGGSFSRVKKGTTIIDNSNGRLWVVVNVLNENNGVYRVNAFPGMLGNLFQNAIVKASYNDNRAKQNSQYPYKLPSNQVSLNAFDEDFLWFVNQDNVTAQTTQLANGTSLGVDDEGNIIIGLNDFTLINGNGSDLKISEGIITLKSAIDAEMKFNPIEIILDLVNPLLITAGSIKDFKSAIYLSADFDVTLGGSVDIVNLSSNTPLTNFIIVVPVGCCAFIELELDVALKTTLQAEANFNLSPRFRSKNDFVAAANYQGLGTLPSFDFEFNNLENISEINENYNVNSNFRLELVPKASVYLYGLVGPSAELTPYLNLSANLDIDEVNNISTWDAKVDYGIDSRLALDINVLGETSWIENSEIGVQEIAEIFNENLFEENLYTAPSELTITLGNNQVGEVNSQLPIPIELEVKDNLENTLSNVYVFFETNNGSFSSNYLLTDAGGVVTNIWTLGSSVDTQNAIAYIKDGSGNIIPESQITITATTEGSTSVDPVNNPAPSNGASDVAINGSLSFIEGANTPDGATFNLYFDINPDPVTVFNLDTNTLNYSSLQEGTVYYWKVETISSAGSLLATSPIWSFTTLTNGGDIQPVLNPTPNSGAIDVALNGDLSFTPGANTPTDAIYRLFFDTNTNPQAQFILGNQTSYNYSNLQEDITYYWKVETLNNTGNVIVSSDIWNFTTEELGCVFDGDIILESQQEINDFGMQNYCGITGDLTIGRSFGNTTPTDIFDLSPLSSLTQIGGSVVRIASNPNLTTLSPGLENINLTELNSDGVGVGIQLQDNNNLTDLNGFGNVSIYSLFLSSNDSLTSLSGFENVSIQALSINFCNSFSSFSGVSNSINTLQILIVNDNDQLLNLSGLDGITVQSLLSVTNNNSLINYCALNNNSGNVNNFDVSGNAYNPTASDILNGNCSL